MLQAQPGIVSILLRNPVSQTQPLNSPGDWKPQRAIRVREDTAISDKGFEEFEKELLFTYNEKRNSQAWNKLPQAYGIEGTAVLLLGQFETNADASGGFGRLGA